MIMSRSKTPWTETWCRRWKERDAREVLVALERSGLPTSRFAARHRLDPEGLRRWRGPSAAIPIHAQLSPRAASIRTARRARLGRVTSAVELPSATMCGRARSPW